MQEVTINLVCVAKP